MKYKKFSARERAEIEQLIYSGYLSYPQIAERYGVGRDRIQSIACKIGVSRPRGSASPHHPRYRVKEVANVI